MKIVKSLEDSGLLIKGVSETIKNETEEQNGGFLDKLLGTSSANLLGNMLSGKRVVTSALCEKQNFRKKKVQREYHIFFFFRKWRKYHIFCKTKYHIFYNSRYFSKEINRAR